MAEKIRGVTIKIGGDTTEFNKSLRDSNNEINNTQRQLKDVERLLKLDPTNVELLRQKEILLNKASDEAKDKIKLLNRQIKDMESKGVDKTSDSYMALKREVIATEKQERKETKTVKKNALAHGTQTKSLGKAKVAFAAIAAAAVAAAVAVTKFLAEATKDAAEYSDDIETLSVQTGISIEKLQELAYMTGLVDTELSTIATAIKKNTQAMGKAAEYSYEYMEAYELLGVSIYDANGELRNSSDVFFEVIDALGKVENETDRDTIAMTLLGKSATDLNPLIEAGAERLAELTKEAHESGYVMSDEVVSGYSAFQDTLDRLTASVTALKNALGKFLLPALNDLGGKALSKLQEFVKVVNDAESIGEVFKYVGRNIQMYAPTLVNALLDLLEEALSAVLDNADDVLDWVVDFVFRVVDSVLEMDWGTILGKLLDNLIYIVFTLLPSFAYRLQKRLLNLFQGIVETLLSGEGLKMIGNLGINIGKALINGLISIVETGINSIISVINKILSIEVFGKSIGGKIDSVALGRLSMEDVGGSFSNLVGAVQSNAGFTRNTTNNYYSQESGELNVNVNFNGDLAGVAAALEPSISATKSSKGIDMVK